MTKNGPVEIINAMLQEAHYQDAKGYSSTHPVSGWLLIMRGELDEALDAWVTEEGDQEALREVLQVMTVGMRCLMQHGIVARLPVEVGKAAKLGLDVARQALGERA
jgi:hypothetical protein